MREHEGPGSSCACTICPTRRAEVNEAIKNSMLIASNMFFLCHNDNSITNTSASSLLPLPIPTSATSHPFPWTPLQRSWNAGWFHGCWAVLSLGTLRPCGDVLGTVLAAKQGLRRGDLPGPCQRLPLRESPSAHFGVISAGNELHWLSHFRAPCASFVSHFFLQNKHLEGPPGLV